MADLPSTREIELETLLRQRDAQIAELTDEVSQLRQYLSSQPAPSTTDPISLPPAFVSLLLPHINNRPASAASPSQSVTAALTQRAKNLQEENDELYELLKTGETGRLKDDVRALRRVVQKLEGALKESHQVIASLSSELDKSQEALLASGRAASQAAHGPSPSPAPRNMNMYQPPPHLSAANGTVKMPPTGPRAHKKARMSESHTPPTHQNPNLNSLPPPPPQLPKRFLSKANAIPIPDVRPRRQSIEQKPVVSTMDVDDDARSQRSRARSPEQDRERELVQEHDRDRDRDRERPRSRDSHRERERPKEKDKDKDKGRDREDRETERVRDRQRDHDRVKDRDRDRRRDREPERDRDRASKRNGARSGGGGGGGGGNGGGGGGGRRGRRDNNGNAAYAGGDRTLAERMGL